MKTHYTLAELESLPTISSSQFDDLKVETDSVRIWLSRMTVEDGEPYNNKVTIERLEHDHRPVRHSKNAYWEVTEIYEAK